MNESSLCLSVNAHYYCIDLMALLVLFIWRNYYYYYYYYCRQLLEELYDLVTVVNVFDSNDVANLALLTRPDLGVTFTKLHCWRLTQYSKCVFLDADTLVCVYTLCVCKPMCVDGWRFYVFITRIFKIRAVLRWLACGLCSLKARTVVLWFPACGSPGQT